MTPTHRRGGRAASTLILTIVALVMALVAAAPTVAQDAATPDPGFTIEPGIPGEPGGEPIEPGEEPETPFDDGATPAVPEDGLQDVTETPWDHITVAPDGRSLTVYYWSGAEGCYGLAGVTWMSPGRADDHPPDRHAPGRRGVYRHRPALQHAGGARRPDRRRRGGVRSPEATHARWGYHRRDATRPRASAPCRLPRRER